MTRFSLQGASYAMKLRSRLSVVALLGAIVLGPTALTGAAGASGIAAQASAQAINVSLLGGAAGYAASNPPTTATSDGSENSVDQNSPSIATLSSESWLSIGALSELAGAYATGTSYACAGVLQSGGSLQIGAGSNCFAAGGSGAGVTINLTAIPGVTSALSGVASVALHLTAITAYADATPNGAVGSAVLGEGSVYVSLAGGGAAPSAPIDLSSAPNQNLITEVVSALNTENDPELAATISALSTRLAPDVELISNYQTTSGGSLSVTGLHVAVLGGSGGVVNLANVAVGPNSAPPGSTTSSGGAPSINGINPSSGPSTGGNLVTLTGSNLGGTTSVDFGGTPANFVVNPDGSLTAVAPAGSGTVDVQATTPVGTSPANPSDRYTYIPGGSANSAGSSGTGGSTSDNSSGNSSGTSSNGAGGLNGSAGSAGICPAGESATGFTYALPLTLHLTYAKVSAGTPVIARVVSGNTIVFSQRVRLSSTHTASIVDGRSASGLLTGEVVFRQRVVEKAPVPLAAPVRCEAPAGASSRAVTFIARLPGIPIGAKLPGTVFSGARAVLSFNVQIRANHVATYLAHTKVTGKLVAKLYRPGTQRHVAITSVVGLSL